MSIAAASSQSSSTCLLNKVNLLQLFYMWPGRRECSVRAPETETEVPSSNPVQCKNLTVNILILTLIHKESKTSYFISPFLETSIPAQTKKN